MRLLLWPQDASCSPRSSHWQASSDMTPSPSKQVIYTYTVLGGELRCGIPPTVTDPNWRLKPLQCTERFIISIIISQIRHLELRVLIHCQFNCDPFITSTRRNTIHSVTGIRSNKYCGSVKCIYWLELSPSPAHRRVRPHSEAMLKSNVTRDKVDTPM